MTQKRTVLIVEARYYDAIADDLAAGACARLQEEGLEWERITVSGVFEIPAAITQILSNDEETYWGVIALGCVIRGQTDHYDHICREASRALMDIATAGVPLGFGILTCNTLAQAQERADPTRKNKGREAANACISMITIAEQFYDGE